jgi:hypothetical protein
MYLFQCLFSAFFFLPVLSAFSQKQLSISATVAPVFTHTNYERRSFYPESNGQIVEPIFLSGSRWESGFLAGATVNYTYAPGWSVTSGIWFRQVAMRQARLAIAGEGTTTIRSRSVRVPLLLNFRQSVRQLSPYFSLGLLVDLPLASQIIAVRNGESTQRLQMTPESGPYFYPMLGAGVQYKLDQRLTLTAQPVFAYSLGRFGGASTHNPAYELSLLAQVAYRLK